MLLQKSLHNPVTATSDSQQNWQMKKRAQIWLSVVYNHVIAFVCMLL